MTGPLRIRKAVNKANIAAGAQTPLDIYLDKLVKMIPGEAMGLYLVGSGFIPSGQSIVLLIWSIVCLAAAIVVKAYGTADAKQKLPPDWAHVTISSLAFVVWIYTLGGPFAAFHIEVPYIGSLLVLALTFFAPLLYPGT